MTINWTSVVTAEDRLSAERAALKHMITAAIDGQVEAMAHSLGYNSAAHLASYAASTVPQWAAQAQDFIRWRDTVWLTAFKHLAAVEAGAAPPTAADVLAALPTPKGA